jgi:hypothetical protein
MWLFVTERARIPDLAPGFNLKPNNYGRLSPVSALTLLVAAIFTDNPDHTLATDNFTVATNALYRSTNFHVSPVSINVNVAARNDPDP